MGHVMSNIFKIRLSFGVLLVCFFAWLSFTGHSLLNKDYFGLMFPFVIAIQFFLLGYQFHEEKAEKNNDS